MAKGKRSPCILPVKTRAQVLSFTKKTKGVKYDAKTDSLARTFEFKERQDAELFVGLALWLANKLWHHPQITIGWKQVTLELRTRDSGGITQKDFDYFNELEKITGA